MKTPFATSAEWPSGRLQSLAEPVVAVLVAVVIGVAASRVASVQTRSRELVLAGLVVLLVLAAVGRLEKVALVLAIIDIPFQWDVNLHYRAAAAHVGALGGLSVSVTTFAVAALYGTWLARWLLRVPGTARPRLRASRPLLAYVVVTALSTLVAADRALAGFEVALLVQTFLLFLYIASWVRSEETLRFVVITLVTALLLEGVAMVALRYGLRLPLVRGHADPSVGGVVARYGGTVGSPNTAASFLAGLIPLSLAVLLMPVRTRFKQLAGLAAMLGVICLVLTGSRGGWTSLAVSLAVLGGIALHQRWLRARQLLIAGVVLVAALLPFASLAAARIKGDDRGAAESRVPLDHLAAQIIEQHPLTGVGVNNVGLVMHRTAGPRYSQDWIFTVHNKYLLVAAEAGLVGLAAFLWFLGSTLRRGFWCVSAGASTVAPVAAGLTAALLGQFVHMTVELFQSRPQIQLLWLVAGLLTAMRALEARRGPAEAAASTAAGPSPELAPAGVRA